MLTVRLAGKAEYGLPETSAATGWQRAWRFLGLVLVLLAFGLRVHDLDTKSIWLDEALSFHRAATLDRAVSGLMVTAGVPSRDTQPPLYFVLLYGLLSLAGASDFAAKFLSVFFSTLLVPVLAVTGVRLGGRQAGLITGLLGAVSPLYIWYAQEVRMYAQLGFCAGLITYLGFRSVSALGQADRRAGATWTVFTGLATLLGTLTQYVAVFMVPAVGFGLAAVLLRRKRLAALLGFGLLAVTGPAFLVDAAWGRIITLPTPQFDRVPIPVTLRDLFARTAGGLTLEGPALDGLTALFAVLVALGLVRGLPRPDRWWLFGMVVIPPLATALVGAQKPLISNVRHLIFATPALYLAGALGIDYLSRRARWAALGVTAVLLAGALVSLVGYFDPNFQKDDFRSLVEYLQANAGPHDLVLAHEATVYHIFEHYDPGYLRVETLPRFGEAVGNRLSPELEARLRELQSSYRRIWLVYWPRSIAGDPTGLVPAWVERNLFAVSDRTFAGRGMGVAVRGYVTRPPTEKAIPDGIRTADLSSADGLKILGWQVAEPATADGRVELSFYFRADRQPLPDYRIIARLVDDRDHIWAAFDGRPIPAWPTGRWSLGEVVRADLTLRLAPGTPAGTYRLEVGLAPGEAGGPAPLLDRAGNPAGTMVGLGEVAVPGAYRSRPDFDRAVPDRLGLQCGCGLRLRELAPNSREILAGRLLTVRGYYQRTGSINPAAYRLVLELRQGDGAAAAGAWPLGPTAPAGSDWLAGVYDLRVPATVEPGEYRLMGRLLGPEGRPETLVGGLGRNLTEVDLGLVRVSVPERRFDPPQPAHPADVYYGNLLHLLGYTLETGDEGRLRVTLYWQVLGSSDRKLKVSVQLFDGPRLVAQDDGVPVNWTRPASTWVPGEYLTDRHEITLPPGIPPNNLTMLVIVYDEATGRRLGVTGPEATGDAAAFALR